MCIKSHNTITYHAYMKRKKKHEKYEVYDERDSRAANWWISYYYTHTQNNRSVDN